MKSIKGLHFVFIIIILTFCSTLYVAAQHNTEKFVVVLDAGHGGHDPGNLGNGFREKDIALRTALKVGEQLEKNPNIKVVYTRNKDVFIGLKERGAIANKARADLFVSIHCNSHGSSAHGTETFVLGLKSNKTNFDVVKKENSVIFLEDDYEKKYAGFDPNSPESVMSILLSQEEYLDQSILLAGLIEKNFSGNLKRKSRGVKQAAFVVLHQTVMPSVLVELGFLTYKSEGTYLNSKKGQLDMSQAIVTAILEYKNSIDANIDYYGGNNSITNTVDKEISSDIVYKVQIAASSNAIDTKPYNFKGLDNITMLKEEKLYKYFYGQTSSYEDAKALVEQANRSGYPSSFVVPFKDGKKITLDEALKTSTN
ncbi:N-acetylmuramoyl-L-alanine amidase [Aestuariivivens marinum]|uniref:N-acetylmuramoyl-L-alanine amidase n=1 Tax=Aestuariivivens marinum TaxID=2913555 RepID=UPI001F56969C|nr:N-acetylmuramoyl-L-alanine amidase [Aestuariivivens marinum]